MKTHSILPNRVVVRRRFTAIKKSMETSLKLLRRYIINQIISYLVNPEAFLSDSFVSVSQ